MITSPASEIWGTGRASELATTRTFGREETLRSPVLAGLKLHLDDIFSS